MSLKIHRKPLVSREASSRRRETLTEMVFPHENQSLAQRTSRGGRPPTPSARQPTSSHREKNLCPESNSLFVECQAGTLKKSFTNSIPPGVHQPRHYSLHSDEPPTTSDNVGLSEMAIIQRAIMVSASFSWQNTAEQQQLNPRAWRPTQRTWPVSRGVWPTHRLIARVVPVIAVTLGDFLHFGWVPTDPQSAHSSTSRVKHKRSMTENQSGPLFVGLSKRLSKI